MSEWDARKNKLIKAREGLPESLREIPLRYVGDVAGLSADALRALDRAYRIEKVNIPRAIQYMRETLVISVEDMIEISRQEKPGPKRADMQIGEACSQATNGTDARLVSSQEDIETLTKLLTACYPSMQTITADALAKSEVMGEALAVVTATRMAIGSDHAKSDFVILALLKLFIETQKQIRAIIQENPAFIKALEQSKINLDQ